MTEFTFEGEWQNPEITSGVVRGIKAWLVSEKGQRTGAQEWLDTIAKVDWDNPSEDDVENYSFIVNHLFSEMDAGNWLNHLFDADGVFDTAVGMLIDELAA